MNEPNNISNRSHEFACFNIYETGGSSPVTWIIETWYEYSPFFREYVMPYFGLGIILYGIYLIKYVIEGKT